MAQGALDQRDQLFLVTRKTARHIGCAQLQRQGDEVDRAVGIHHAALVFRALVGRGGELALGQAIDAVVFDDVGHVHATPHGMRELADADGGRVAVTRNPQVDEVAIGQRRAGQHRGHAAVGSVEAVRVAEEVIGCFRRAADAGKLGHPMWFDVKIETGLDYGGTDRVVAATGTQRRNCAFIVAARVAQRVLRRIRAEKFGFGEISHEATLRSGVTLWASSAAAMRPEMKLAVIGVPS